MITQLSDLSGRALDYDQYTKLITDLLALGKSTGEKQTVKRTEVSRLNAHRMSRVMKTTKLDETIKEAALMARPQYWMVLTEGWCGDSAHCVPVMELVARASGGKIDFGIFLRDDNPELMDKYLLNGGRSIPRLVAYDKSSGEELAIWGPRPAPVQQMMMDYKANPDENRDIQIEMQQWYNADKSATMQNELLEILRK